MIKPISPTAHTFFDYLFSAALFIIPPLIDVNPKAARGYRQFGAVVTAFNALTDTGAGFVRVIPFKIHKAGDYANVTGFAAAGFSKTVRNDKKALAFHITFFALAITHIMLTDYNGSRN